MFAIIVAALVSVTSAHLYAASYPPQENLTEQGTAEWYLEKFNQTFSSEEEKRCAMVNLVNAHEEVRSNNELFDKGQRNFLLEVYSFDVMTPEEIASTRTGSAVSDMYSTGTSRKRRYVPQGIANPLLCVNPPDYKNWAEEGYVSAPLDQGSCSNCYVFSAISALESAVMITYGTPADKLSEQLYTDCVRSPNPKSSVGGCNRGRAEWVWNATKIHNGAVASTSYQNYTATDTEGCNCSLPKVPNSSVDHWLFNTWSNEETLKCALSMYGPHHISMDFSGSIANYKSGIYDDPKSTCNSSLVNGRMVKPYNHAISLVGYGSELNNAGVMTDYWLAKNSWGARWGMNGYIKIARNQNNLCHVATDAIVPILLPQKSILSTVSLTTPSTNAPASTSATTKTTPTTTTTQTTLTTTLMTNSTDQITNTTTPTTTTLTLSATTTPTNSSTISTTTTQTTNPPTGNSSSTTNSATFSPTKTLSGLSGPRCPDCPFKAFLLGTIDWGAPYSSVMNNPGAAGVCPSDMRRYSITFLTLNKCCCY